MRRCTLLIKKIGKIITAAMLAVSVTISSVPMYAAADSPSFEVLLSTGKAYYYKNGVKQYYDNSNRAYVPSTENDDILVSVSRMADILNAEYTYDSSNDKITVTANGKTLISKIGEDKITVDGAEKYIETPTVYTGSRTLVPIKRFAENLGFNAVSADEITAIGSRSDESADDANALLLRARPLFYDGIYRNDFSDGGITFKYWGRATSGGYSDKVSHDGGTSGYINSPQTSMAMFVFPFVLDDDPTKRVHFEYNIRARVLVTEDYNANEPYAFMSMNRNGSWKRYVYATPDKKPVPGQWTEITFKFLYRNIYRSDLVASSNTNEIKFGVGTHAKNASEDNLASGTIYYDDVRIERALCADGSAPLTLLPSNNLSWYVLGDTVTYTVADEDKAVLDGFDSVTGYVYNMDGDIIYSSQISAARLSQSGWSWTPQGLEQTGAMYAEFVGTKSDGTVCTFENLQRFSVGNAVHDAGITEHRFVVAAKETKPQSERNPSVGINATSATGYRMANAIGFSSVRYHYLKWGDSQLFKGIHKGLEQFDWTEADNLMQGMGETDMTLMVNIFGSPKWALPQEYQSVTGGMVAGGMKYNGYGIQNQEYVRDFFTAYLERYGAKTDIIEFWNEPGAASAFWYDHEHDDVLINMLKTVHECVSEYNLKNGADVKIAFAGYLASGEKWIKNFMQIDDNSESYYDIFSVHGNYNEANKIYNYVYSETGFERKPWMNSETYSVTLDTDRDAVTGKRNQKTRALAALMNYFYHIKNGASYTYDFRATADVSDDYVDALFGAGGSLNYWGMSTDYGTHAEPYTVAYPLHVFFDIMGTDFHYEKEYSFNKSYVGVRFANGGEPIVAVWNKETASRRLGDDIRAIFGEDTYMIDFEGHRVSPDSVLDGEKLYWIIKPDADALSSIADSPDSVLAPNNSAPYYTASATPVKKHIPVSQLKVPKAYMTNGRLFDEKTFGVTNTNIKWIDTDFNWVSSQGEKPEDFGAKFAASFTKDGFYLMVDVADGTFGINESDSTMASYWNYDGIQFALDVFDSGNAENRLECAAAQTSKGTFVFKAATPDFGEQLITDYTKKGEYIEGRYVNVTDTDHGKLYKIFFPTSELYPMSYPIDSDCIRFSLLINNNNGTGRLGYLEWSSGIGAAKSPSQYGALIYDN